MHEFFALLFFAGAVKMTLTGGFWGVMGILFGGCSLFYFSISVTARFNNKIGRWFRINPGVPTPMDEREWAALGDKTTAAGIAKNLMEKSAVAKNPPPRQTQSPAPQQMPEMSHQEMQALARRPQEFPERRPETAALNPQAKAKPEEVIYYDPGYEDMRDKNSSSSSKKTLEKQFDAIFSVE